MPNPVPIDSLRSDIDKSLSVLTTLMQNATNEGGRAQLQSIIDAMTAIATQIDNEDLTSTNDAIAALVTQLGPSASDLAAIHQQAVDLQQTLNIAQSLLTAFGNVAGAVTGNSNAAALAPAAAALTPAPGALAPAPPPVAAQPVPRPVAAAAFANNVAENPFVPPPAAGPQPAVGVQNPGAAASVVLVLAFVGNIFLAPSQPLYTWLLTVPVIAVSLALYGLSGGRWESTFIDNRNRISLSKLQVILWTIAIFSALLSAACFNAGVGGDGSSIMGIVVDPKLWGLLGISVTTAVGTPIALSSKGSQKASGSELADTQKNLKALTGVAPGNIQSKGHILIKINQTDARWSDLIRGDDVGNGDTIDFSKVQQLYFTLLTLLIFGVAVANKFTTAVAALPKAVIPQLPVPDSGFLGLLAASGAGYLVYKGMSHSQDGSKANP